MPEYRWTQADVDAVNARRGLKSGQSQQASEPATLPQDKRTKYGAVRTEVDGISFHSAKEAKRYGELKLLEKAGEIKDLELQPRFELLASSPEYQQISVGEYIADFRYRERMVWLAGTEHETVSWKEVIEDVKGMRTPVYRLKKKIAEACHGIMISEV